MTLTELLCAQVTRPNSAAGARGYGPTHTRFGDGPEQSAQRRLSTFYDRRLQRPATAAAAGGQVAPNPMVAARQMAKAGMHSLKYRRPQSGWGGHRVVISERSSMFKNMDDGHATLFKPGQFLYKMMNFVF